MGFPKTKMYHFFSCLFKESHTGRKTRNSTFKLGYSWPLLSSGRISRFFITIHLTGSLMEWTGLCNEAMGKWSWVTQVIEFCSLMSEKWTTFQYVFGTPVYSFIKFHFVKFESRGRRRWLEECMSFVLEAWKENWIASRVTTAGLMALFLTFHQTQSLHLFKQCYT